MRAGAGAGVNLVKRHALKEGLRHVAAIKRPIVLKSCHANNTLSPPRGRGRHRLGLAALQVLASPKGQSSFDNTLAVHELPCQDPTRIQAIGREIPREAPGTVQVGPALKLIAHSLRALLCVLCCLITGQDVHIALDDNFFTTFLIRAHHEVMACGDCVSARGASNSDA